MREHQWEKKESYKDSPYEERYCPVCELEEKRSHEGKRPWKVDTPCIEPVPSSVTYEALIKEIAEVVMDPRAALDLRRLVHCAGVPGAWYVGIATGDGYVLPHRTEKFKELNEGFAALLRWLRARQFDPYKYSDLAYAQRLARRESNVADED